MKNYHLLKVKYLGPTNNRGSRVKITSERFYQSIIIPYNYSLNTINEMAREALEAKGFFITGQAEGKNNNYLLSEDFKELK